MLPIVFRDRFVGRTEPRIDRDHARVQVLGLWWEDGVNCASHGRPAVVARARDGATLRPGPP